MVFRSAGYRKNKDPDPGFALTEPIYDVARFYQRIIKEFPVGGAVPFNSGWTGSPVREMHDCFKAFTLAGGQKRKQILVTVLDPKGASLTFDLQKAYALTAHEITGEQLTQTVVGPGTLRYYMPKPHWEKACVLLLKAV